MHRSLFAFLEVAILVLDLHQFAKQLYCSDLAWKVAKDATGGNNSTRAKGSGDTVQDTEAISMDGHQLLGKLLLE